jgi:hypothetical protein
LFHIIIPNNTDQEHFYNQPTVNPGDIWVNGNLIYRSRYLGINDNYKDTWFSGFAFSTNFWGHCKISGRTLYLNLNDNNTSSTFNKFTNMIEVTSSTGHSVTKEGVKIISDTTSFRIPFVNNNRDKIFYLVEVNRDFSN